MEVIFQLHIQMNEDISYNGERRHGDGCPEPKILFSYFRYYYPTPQATPPGEEGASY